MEVDTIFKSSLTKNRMNVIDQYPVNYLFNISMNQVVNTIIDRYIVRIALYKIIFLPISPA